MAEPMNGLPQITRHWTARCSAGVYVGSNLREPECMQNQQSSAEAKVLRPSPFSFDMMANPKVVLMGAGLLGLAVDLFVRPISPAGLALILLATAPWILQAWVLRPQFGTSNIVRPTAQAEAAVQGPTRKALQEQRNDTSGQKTGAGRPERLSQPTAGTIRKVPPAEPAARQLPLGAGGSELERGRALTPGSEIRASPPRTA
jgi:hypothetical protein